MNIKEFKQRLTKHDWHYAQSHDSRVYERGLAEEKALLSMTQGKITYKNAYNSHFKKIFK